MFATIPLSLMTSDKELAEMSRTEMRVIMFAMMLLPSKAILEGLCCHDSPDSSLYAALPINVWIPSSSMRPQAEIFPSYAARLAHASKDAALLPQS